MEAVFLAIGILFAPLFPATTYAIVIMFVAAILFYIAYTHFSKGWKALLSLLLFIFVIGVLRPFIPDFLLVPEELLAWSRELSKKLFIGIGNLGLNEESTALLQAMLLGNKSNLSESVSQLYRLSGSAHVLALSGMHLGVLFGAFNVLLVRVLNYRIRYLIGIIELVLIWCYALLTGFPVSLCRASFMMSLFVISQVRLAGNNGWHTLGLTAFVLLMISPSSIYDVGFQLSFAAVAGILLFHPLFSDIWHPQRPLYQALWQMFFVSFSAQLGVMPLLLHYFHYISLSAIILSPFYVLLATVIIYLSLSAMLMPIFASLVNPIVHLQHSLMAYSLRILPGDSLLRVNLHWGKVLLLYMALICFAPVLYRLRKSATPVPQRRLAMFFSSWPYVLATLLLLSSVILM